MDAFVVVSQRLTDLSYHNLRVSLRFRVTSSKETRRVWASDGTVSDAAGHGR